jgi:hypothetical protein
MRLIDRMPSCFNGVGRSQEQDYLNNLRGAWRDISTALTRNAWIMVLLLAAYELAAHGAVANVTVGPFALSNLKFLRLFVPVVVSYLFYEQIILAIRWIETEAVHRYLTRALTPNIEEFDFDTLLAPRLPALSNLVHSFSPSSATLSKHLRAAGQYVLGAVFFCVIPTFDGFAFKSMYDDYNATAALYWINVVVTSGLLALSVSVFILWLLEERLLTEA